MMLLLLTVILGCSVSGDDAFQEGLTALRNGDASTAVQSLSLSVEQGAKHPSVYHALGNGLYRLDQLGEAAAAWRRGLSLAPRNGDIAANLDHVRKQFQDRLEPPMAHRGAFFWQSELAPLETGIVASVALSFACWIVLLARLRRLRGSPDLSSSARWTAGVAAAVGLLLAVSTADGINSRQGAVVVADEVDVRSALGPAGVSLFVLHEGAEVLVIDKTQTHQLIVLADGRKGWVSVTSLLSTDPAKSFPLAKNP
jgi:hypothetical protein